MSARAFVPLQPFYMSRGVEQVTNGTWTLELFYYNTGRELVPQVRADDMRPRGLTAWISNGHAPGTLSVQTGGAALPAYILKRCKAMLDSVDEALQPEEFPADVRDDTGEPEPDRWDDMP